MTTAYNFTFEGKALATHELADGDLLIQGWAADFSGIDRQGENFTDGAFQRGIKSFLTNGGALCYHHRHDQAIGKVLDLKEVKGKGLWLSARVDKQEPSSPLFWIYNGIKKGTMRGLSVGGFFKRLGRRISNVDFTEVSVTPVPVHPRTGFAVVGGKALEDDVPSALARARRDCELLHRAQHEVGLLALQANIAALNRR